MDSTLGIIKKMTFQSEKRWEIYFKAMTWKKNGEWIFIVSCKGKKQDTNRISLGSKNAEQYFGYNRKHI